MDPATDEHTSVGIIHSQVIGTHSHQVGEPLNSASAVPPFSAEVPPPLAQVSLSASQLARIAVNRSRAPGLAESVAVRVCLPQDLCSTQHNRGALGFRPLIPPPRYVSHPSRNGRTSRSKVLVRAADSGMLVVSTFFWFLYPLSCVLLPTSDLVAVCV